LSAPTITPGAQAFASDNPQIEASIIIISFNTRDLLHESLTSCAAECAAIPSEIFVVDNGSTDGSILMVESEFPHVILLKSDVNLGFGVANNVALQQARGRYFVLLNSDAFFTPGSLARAIRHMDETPACGLGGALLQGRGGRWQPSAKRFHSIFDDLLVFTGLADKFPKSRLFGRMSRTWADESQPAQVDWVPGAFAIIRPSALRQVGLFDPIFFLYYEEVDLCLRLKQAGFQIWYWPDVLIIHLGGESSKKLTNLEFSTRAAQVVLWRMRSTLLYYRKHHGAKVWLAKWMEKTLYTITVLRNRWSRIPARRDRERHYRTMIALMDQAWTETNGGRISPPRPW
jgi:GT2 family glycosyltransferase